MTVQLGALPTSMHGAIWTAHSHGRQQGGEVEVSEGLLTGRLQERADSDRSSWRGGRGGGGGGWRRWGGKGEAHNRAVRG